MACTTASQPTDRPTDRTGRGRRQGSPLSAIFLRAVAALIAAAQTVEHYEIARYGTLVAWATQLGRADCAALLAETLCEEKAADAKLSSLAELFVNCRAAA